MSCDLCSLQIDEEFPYKADWAGCNQCHNEITPFFPRPAIYKGMVNKMHRAHLVEPINCPNCGQIITWGETYCKNDGVVVEIPTLIQLPMEIENDKHA